MSSEVPSIVALIPARSGSKRIADKNIRPLNGHPLIAYSICAARASKLFTTVVVSTDSARYAEISRKYGAEVPFLRPQSLGDDLSADIDWVEHALTHLRNEGLNFDCFSILRPTSPFRQATTIQHAWRVFLEQENIDSLRAVEKCKEHPAKMWLIRHNRMLPLLPLGPEGQPWHSTPYQALPEIYVQNASLEIAWSRIVFNQRSISGTIIVPFFTEGLEGYDLNREQDWEWAEELIRTSRARLPEIY